MRYFGQILETRIKQDKSDGMCASRIRRWGEAVAEGGLPDGVDAVHVDGADFLVWPAPEGVDEAAGVAGVHGVARHVHLAGAQALDGGALQQHACQLAVGAVGAQRRDGWHHELVEVRPLRRPLLVPRPFPLPHDQCLRPLAHPSTSRLTILHSVCIHDTRQYKFHGHTQVIHGSL